MFNLKRFILLEKYKWRETRAHFIVMALLVCIIYTLCILADFNRNTQLVCEETYGHQSVIFSIFALILAPCFLEVPVNRRNAIFDTLLPATTFEKFSHIWLKYLLILPLFVFLFVQALNGMFQLSGIPYLCRFASEASFIDSVRADHWGMFAIVQPIFFVGYFCFKSKNLLKSLGVFGGFIIVFILLIIFFRFMQPDDLQGYAMWNMGAYAECNYPLSFIDSVLLYAGNILFPILFVISSWIAGFFILREKEV